MTHLRRTLISAFIAAAATLPAAAYSVLLLTDRYGSDHMYTITPDLVIALDDKCLTIHDSDGMFQYTIDSFSRFSYHMTSGDAPADALRATVDIQLTASGITLTAPDDTPRSYTVHTAAGRLISAGTYTGTATVSITDHAPGLYILTLDDNTSLKYTIR